MARQDHDKADGPNFIDTWHETLAVDMAIGYSLITGRGQAVLLHAGAGLLQGSMGILGARHWEVPTLAWSGESVTYGEDPDLEPGQQRARNLSSVGGPHRLIEPVVKYSCQATSPSALFEMVIRAGEMAALRRARPSSACRWSIFWPKGPRRRLAAPCRRRQILKPGRRHRGRRRGLGGRQKPWDRIGIRGPRCRHFPRLDRTGRSGGDPGL
jgi:hypothetical protein